MLRAFRQYLDGDGADALREAEGLTALDRGKGDDIDLVIAEAKAVAINRNTVLTDCIRNGMDEPATVA